MNFRQLQVFQEVATRRSFTAAAEALMLSQPAASLHVRSLERSLGVRLLERTPQGLVITEAGEATLAAATTILSTIGQMEQAVAEIRGARRGRVVIGANTTGGMYVTPRVVAAFRSAQPEIEVVLHIDSSDRLYERMAQGVLDIVIAGGPGDAERFDVRRLCRDEVIAVVHPAHAAIARAPLGLAELAREDLVLAEPGSRMRALVESVFRRVGIVIRPRLVLAGTEALKKAAESALGIAFVSVYAAERELTLGTLAAVAVSDASFQRDYEIATLKGRYVTPAIAGFLEFAVGYAGEHLRTPPVPERTSRARRRRGP